MARTNNTDEKQSEVVLRLLSGIPRVVDTHGNVFISFPDEIRTDFIPIDSDKACQQGIWACYIYGGLMPTEQTVKAVLRFMAEQTRRQNPTLYDIRPRIAKDGKDYVYDHADETGNCTRFNANDWTYCQNSTVPFNRAMSAPTPEPIRPSSIDEAFEIMHHFQDLQRLPDSDRLPRFAALIEDLKPDTPFAVRHNQGPAGSGKTTAASLEIQLIDPYENQVPPQVVPDIEHMAVAAKHRHYLFFDNVGRIDNETSNYFCCAAYGTPIIWRTMHERSGATTLKMHSPIQITGIHYHLAPDLADRSIVTEFPVRSDYLPPSKLQATFHTNHGRYLGALFTLAVETLRRI